MAVSKTKAIGHTFTFNDKELVASLVKTLSPRAREVVVARFGLGTQLKRETLESIGERQSVTRERVRQIETLALENIRQSEAFKQNEEAFLELSRYVYSLGSILTEEQLLNHINGDQKRKNRFRFLLTLDNQFIREKETEEFFARWHIDEKTADNVHSALVKLYATLPDNDVIEEGELITRFLRELGDINAQYQDEEVLKRWLSCSKNIGSNPLKKWGKAHIDQIKIKGIRDYAYIVVRNNKAPLHFREVASLISKLFQKKAHIATTHNELMKDDRFVLVGRGLYGLKEWGFEPGVVKDVIAEVLKTGPKTRQEVLEEVKRKRQVKDNTILVNLNNPKFFKRQKDGTYSLK
jgi:hypothetical protein